MVNSVIDLRRTPTGPSNETTVSEISMASKAGATYTGRQEADSAPARSPWHTVQDDDANPSRERSGISSCSIDSMLICHDSELLVTE